MSPCVSYETNDDLNSTSGVGKETHLIRHTIGIEVATVDGEVLRATSFVEVNTLGRLCKRFLHLSVCESRSLRKPSSVEQVVNAHLPTLHELR
jgi:hypothetical protein